MAAAETVVHVFDLVAAPSSKAPRLPAQANQRRFAYLFAADGPVSRYAAWYRDEHAGDAAVVPEFLVGTRADVFWPAPLQLLTGVVRELGIPWQAHGDHGHLMVPSTESVLLMSGDPQEAADQVSVTGGCDIDEAILHVWSLRHRYTNWLSGRSDRDPTAARRYEAAAAAAAAPYVQVALDALRAPQSA